MKAYMPTLADSRPGNACGPSLYCPYPRFYNLDSVCKPQSGPNEPCDVSSGDAACALGYGCSAMPGGISGTCVRYFSLPSGALTDNRSTFLSQHTHENISGNRYTCPLSMLKSRLSQHTFLDTRIIQ